MSKIQEKVIKQTQTWLQQVVIGYNFCPFAKREFDKGSIHYQVSTKVEMKAALLDLINECQRLDQNKQIETSLIIFSNGFKQFDKYLDLLDIANQLLDQQGYSGIYQLASFHPDYCFDGADADDASNYTNRAPYPTFHLLRESSLEKALTFVEDPAAIPERNIECCQEKGSAHFQQILADIAALKAPRDDA